MHDWPRRTGDMPPRGARISCGGEKRAERAAFDDIARGAGGAPVAAAYGELHEDDEQRAVGSATGQAADIIDLLVQALAFERAGVEAG